MEDKRVCPHCGAPLYKRRYLMSRDPDGEMVWPPSVVRAAFLLIFFLVLVAAFSLQHTT